MSFSDYMEKKVLRPLKMNNSSFLLEGAIKANSSLEHNHWGKPIPFELFTAKAAAGFHTTIDDFTKFALANLDLLAEKRKKKVLKGTTLDMMTTAATSTEGRYGLGYFVDAVSDKTVLTGHGGANTGWKAMFLMNKKNKDGFIMFTNGTHGSNVHTHGKEVIEQLKGE